MANRKILITDGYGAGWTSWETNIEIKKYMLSYAPIIEFLENDGEFTYDDCNGWPNSDSLHPLLKRLISECQDKFGDYPCVGGAKNLIIDEIGEGVQVVIDDRDGNENGHVTYGYGWI